MKTGFVSPMSMISALNSRTTVEAVRAKTRISDDKIVEHVMAIWLKNLGDITGLGEAPSNAEPLEVAANVHQIFENLARDGAFRTGLTSELVNEYVEGVEVHLDERVPPLSRAALKDELRERVEVVKNLTYELVVRSPNLKTVEYRGSRIVKTIFKALSEPDGNLLMPDDYQSRLREQRTERDRTICDFIAGMTDRYALEFFGRLTSEGARTIFKPL